MMTNQSWQLRKSAVLALKILLLKIQDESLNKEVFEMLTGNLQDRVFEVRRVTLQVLQDLCKELGQTWTENNALKILSA